jgi:Lambda phage tail tube protein, TTP
MSNAICPRGTQLQRGTNVVTPGNYATLAEVRKISRTGAKAGFDNVTSMDSGPNEEMLATILTPGQWDFEVNFIPGDASQQTLLDDYNNQVLSPWKVQLPNQYGNWTFLAYVESEDVSLDFGKAATKSVKLQVTGAVTWTPGV